jgi:GR25 family glycosyltransferase involved in LPS biosynthesis
MDDRTFALLLVLIVSTFMLLRKRYKIDVDYKAFLLTLPSSTKRQETFMRHYNSDIPLETIYGKDTKSVENATKYKKYVKPEYFNEAIEMHYDSVKKRPDITYFNMGAIGCYMGHMEFYKRCFDQNIKYALMFEDNVIILNDDFYKKVQSVIDTLGDDFEICFFHCLSRYSDGEKQRGLERVKWITSMKCYLVHVENMKKYYKYFFPIDNHVDLKHEDIIAAGARVYYKDLRRYIKIDRSGPSTIGHSDWGNKHFFSRQFPSETPDRLKGGY